MIFRNHVAERAHEAYQIISSYFAEVRSFYEVVSTRLATGEYGVSLASLERRRLFSSADSYSLQGDLGDDKRVPGSCPAYIWFPTWFGSFYVDSNAYTTDGALGDSAQDGAHLMAFVWTWIGLDDAYVDDVPKPECWFGIARLTDMYTGSIDEMASKIWRFFRFEWTMEVEIDGWLKGSFQQNTIGCNLAGVWYLRRVTLCQLASYYQVEKLIVRPLSEKFYDLMNGPQAGGN